MSQDAHEMLLAALVVGLPYLMIWGTFAFFAASLAKARRRGYWTWWLLGLIFGPLGLVVAFYPVRADNDPEDAAEPARRIGRAAPSLGDLRL